MKESVGLGLYGLGWYGLGLYRIHSSIWVEITSQHYWMLCFMNMVEHSTY